MSYLDTLSTEQKSNIDKIVRSMVKNGITNPNSIGGLLAVVSKESAFVPKNETSYKNTPVSRIRQIFGTRVSKLTDAQIETLKKDDKKFFDQVYGGQWKSLGFGNDSAGDGYKYRGRGFNGITGKSVYAKYQKLTGHPIVSEPELLNDVNVASDVLIAYFKNRFSASNNKLPLYNSTGINDFKTVSDAALAFYHANAGWGSSISGDPTGGKKKTLDRAPLFTDYVKKNISGITSGISNIMSLFIGITIGVIGYIAYTKL